MAISERTALAIEACIDSVMEPQRWPAALQLLAESVGAESCTFCSGELQQASSRVMPVSSGHAEFAALWMRNEASAPDPHFILCRKALATGRMAALEDDVTTPEQRRSLAYYQETARPADREHWAMSYFGVGDVLWGVPFYRGRRHGPFQLEEIPRLVALGPHMAKVVLLTEKFATRQVAAELSALERLRCAALVIDAFGRVIDLNAPAQGLLGDDFAIRSRRPVAADRASNARLQRLLAAVAAASSDQPTEAAPVAIRRDGRPWLLASALPVTAFGSNFFLGGRAILLLTELTPAARPDADALRAAFGLTAAEARLAVELASGKGIEDCAGALGISRATACTQLRAVFAKTETRRQAELAGLLARFRPAARPGGSGNG